MNVTVFYIFFFFQKWEQENAEFQLAFCSTRDICYEKKFKCFEWILVGIVEKRVKFRHFLDVIFQSPKFSLYTYELLITQSTDKWDGFSKLIFRPVGSFIRLPNRKMLNIFSLNFGFNSTFSN